MRTLKKIFFSIALVLLCWGCGYLVVTNMRLKASLDERKTDFRKKIDVEREKIVQDMKEKYAADIVSYEAMAKRLELEKQRSEEARQDANEIKKELLQYRAEAAKDEKIDKGSAETIKKPR